jgi:hypothetical protein
MGQILAGGKDVSCDFCGTGTENLKLLVRNPNKGKGSSSGSVTKFKICKPCLKRAKRKDESGWQRRISSGRYAIEDL